MEQTMPDCDFILLWCKSKGQVIAGNGGVGGIELMTKSRLRIGR